MTQMNSPMKQKQTHRHREQTCGCQEGGVWVGKDWELGVSRYKLVYIGWINNKVLLYSTGNYIQYPVINHNGREYEKEYIKRKNIYIYIYIHIYESFCGTPETNTTL